MYSVLYTWRITLKPGETKILRIKYRMRLQGFFTASATKPRFEGYRRFVYVLETGRNWQGKIGSISLTVSLRDHNKDMIRIISPLKARLRGSTIRYFQKNIEPKDDFVLLLKDYKWRYQQKELPLKERWSYKEALDKEFSFPIVTTNKAGAYFTFTDTRGALKVKAIDFSGKILWEKLLPWPAVRLAANDNYLAVLSVPGWRSYYEKTMSRSISLVDRYYLFVLDAASGKKLWQKTFALETYNEPELAVTRDRVFLAFDKFYSFGVKDGTQLLKLNRPTAPPSKLIVLEDNNFLTLTREGLSAYSADGQKIWQLKGNFTKGIGLRDEVLVTRWQAKKGKKAQIFLQLIDFRSGKLIWQRPWDKGYYYFLSAHDRDFIYLLEDLGRLTKVVKIDRRTGKFLITRTLKTPTSPAYQGNISQPFLHKGKLFIETSDSNLLALRSKDLKVLWRYQSPRYAEYLRYFPTIKNGKPFFFATVFAYPISAGWFYGLEPTGKNISSKVEKPFYKYKVVIERFTNLQGLEKIIEKLRDYGFNGRLEPSQRKMGVWQVVVSYHGNQSDAEETAANLRQAGYKAQMFTQLPNDYYRWHSKGKYLVIAGQFNKLSKAKARLKKIEVVNKVAWIEPWREKYLVVLGRVNTLAEAKKLAAGLGNSEIINTKDKPELSQGWYPFYRKKEFWLTLIVFAQILVIIGIVGVALALIRKARKQRL
jgi:outer membrane protein assembly factor BamB